MKFYIHRLGCPKNDVDAEYISARLIDDGHVPVSRPEEAESIIVNTCGFILPAREESISELLELAELKKNGRLRTLFASGCLSQRHGDELLAGIPELDGVFGIGAHDSLAEALAGPSSDRQVTRQPAERLEYLAGRRRHLLDDYPYAYLKISDGCDRLCSFCAIPSIRGKYRSRHMDSILEEAEFLASKGRKELILVSQEATLWGFDLPGRPALTTLLDALGQIDSVRWIRLLYLYPTQVNDALIEYVASQNKTLDYFDLPLQHCNTEILSAMRRQTTRDETERLIGKIRDRAPGATFRVALIAGFPGETEEQFEELKDFVCAQRFERLGVFQFSTEDGTLAAQLPGRVPEEVVASRVDQLMYLQHDIAVSRNNSLIGNIEDVIIDRVNDDGKAVGRTKADCPEVDQEVRVTGNNLETGEICRVRIEAVDEYDLIGSKLTE